jgi:hypothetical protein
MGGKGGFRKTLEHRGRAYRLQKSQGGLSVGAHAARNLRGQRLGVVGAAAAAAEMESDRKRRRFRRGEHTVDVDRSDPAGVKPESADAAASSDEDGDEQQEKLTPEMIEAKRIQTRLYREVMTDAADLLRDAFKALARRTESGETSRDAVKKQHAEISAGDVFTLLAPN